MRHDKYISVRIDKEEYYEAIRVKECYKRNIKGQVSYWTKLGRYMVDNPELTGRDIERLVVESALRKQEGYSIHD